MRPFLGIVIQTLRHTLRARVFLVVLCLVVVSVFLLPFTVNDDGTLAGHMQLTLTYSLGVLTALISFSAVIVASASLAREIEGYQMHLVLSTPTPRWLVWLGKWAGIFLVHAFLFVIGAAIIYGSVFWKVRSWRQDVDRLKTLLEETRQAATTDLTESARARRAARADDLTKQFVGKVEELDKLHSEILVGRREYQPEQPDLNQAVDMNYRQKLAQFEPGHNPTVVKGEILRLLKAGLTDVAPGYSRRWQFTGLRIGEKTDRIFVRYRCYAGSTSKSEQKFIPEFWGIRNFSGKGPEWVPVQRYMISGVFHEFNFPVTWEPEPGVRLQFISDKGEAQLLFSNPQESTMSMVFQLADGPALLVPDSTFTGNYARVILLVFLQLGFLVALGCCVSAALTTPVALFVAVAYLVIGLSVQSALAAQYKDDFGDYQYRGVVNPALHLVARGVSKVVVSLNDFDASSDLSKGRQVTNYRLLLTLRDLIGIRTLMLVGLGMVFLTRRELGTVVRG